MRYLSKRTLLGTLLFLIFVGEPTVGFRSGLFTSPVGFLVLIGLYTVLFLLYESLIQRFNLTNGRLILLTFSIYAVIVTGLLHGEIADYALHPHDWLVTTLIRIQCSMFPPFAYYLLNKIYKRDSKRILSVGKALLVAMIYILLLTLTHRFGLIVAIETFRTAPIPALLYSIVGAIALLIALFPTNYGNPYRTKSLTAWTWLLFALAIVPLQAFFIVLLLVMPVVTIVYSRIAAWREAPV